MFLSLTPKAMRSLSSLSCKQSQKLHIFRRFFGAATQVSVVSFWCAFCVLNLYLSNASFAVHLTDDNGDRVGVCKVHVPNIAIRTTSSSFPRHHVCWRLCGFLRYQDELCDQRDIDTREDSSVP